MKVEKSEYQHAAPSHQLPQSIPSIALTHERISESIGRLNNVSSQIVQYRAETPGKEQPQVLFERRESLSKQVSGEIEDWRTMSLKQVQMARQSPEASIVRPGKSPWFEVHDEKFKLFNKRCF